MQRDDTIEEQQSVDKAGTPNVEPIPNVDLIDDETETAPAKTGKRLEKKKSETWVLYRTIPGDVFYLQYREEFIKRKGYDAFDARHIYYVLTEQQIAEYRAVLPCIVCKRPAGKCKCHEKYVASSESNRQIASA